MIRVFIACSLDGFIAGPDDELDWLPGHDEVEDTFTPFFAGVGAMLIGRRTYDVVAGFSGPWPYGETPVLVATRRPLPADQPSVRAVSGTIAELLEEARRIAGDRDVYLDGGDLVRQGLDAGLVDEMTVTMIPTVLGAGLPLFAGCARRHPLELLGVREIGRGLVQLRYRPSPPVRATSSAGYSGTPLAKKLGIKEGARVLALGAPDGYLGLLEGLPAGVRLANRTGPAIDLVHLFVTRKAELQRRLSGFRKRLRPDTAIWISWPKQASKVATDITEETIREVALPLGYVDIKVCAVTAVWSGLKLVLRKELR